MSDTRTPAQRASDDLLAKMQAAFTPVVLPTPAMDCSGVVTAAVWWVRR